MRSKIVAMPALALAALLCAGCAGGVATSRSTNPATVSPVTAPAPSRTPVATTTPAPVTAPSTTVRADDSAKPMSKTSALKLCLGTSATNIQLCVDYVWARDGRWWYYRYGRSDVAAERNLATSLLGRYTTTREQAALREQTRGWPSAVATGRPQFLVKPQAISVSDDGQTATMLVVEHWLVTSPGGGKVFYNQPPTLMKVTLVKVPSLVLGHHWQIDRLEPATTG